MNKIIYFIIYLVCAGCIHKNIQKNLEKETNLTDSIQNQISLKKSYTTEPSQATSSIELWDIIDELIIKSQFSTQQKYQLNELCLELEEKLELNNIINIKLRALLFTELLSPYYDDKQIAVIKAMLEQNHFERNSLLLNAIDITNLITKRKTLNEESEQPYQDFYLLY